MATKKFDLVIIGGGPGGYVCAIRAAQLGLSTALVEKRPTLGGTCLNIGCIPSKALLHSTEMLHFAKENAAQHGIKLDKVSVDVPTMMKKKDSVVSNLVKGVGMLVEKKGVTVFKGTGTLQDPHTIQVESGRKKETIEADKIVLATGSVPSSLPGITCDGKDIVTSDEALSFDKVPERLVVIGAGAIGLELGSVWSRMGSQVSVMEFLPRVAATYDSDISKAAERIFKKQGLTFHTDTKVTGVDKGKKGLTVKAEAKGKKFTVAADKVLVAVGRKAFTEKLGLDRAGVKVDERGRVETDQRFRTNVENIFAIGDLIQGPMLAHKAEEEGVALAELIAGEPGHVNYDVIPNVIYTEPEVASAGMGEDEAKKAGKKIKVGKFPLSANGRALATDATEGLFKVIADAETDRVLGVQIISAHASELIAAAVTHMEYGGSAEDIARTVHAHPTLSESLKEAALAVDKRALHSL
ncbi:MAG: dihydrolipoyl dehydrogenase [Opitutales bacterium]|nr:dihydrolipoyl dehydrogenase [Opitutales bacterium]MCH8541645.1 dihydrolipoyl dehydrogenase [Opitutales bacterium]